MLIKLTPRNDFKTKAEREAKWRNRHILPTSAKGEKKFPYKFNEIFQVTDYDGIYYSDFYGYDIINSYCKQKTFMDSAKYWKTRPSTRFRRLYPTGFADHEKNIQFQGVADNLDQIVEFYNNSDIFKGNHVIICKNIELQLNKLNMPDFGLFNIHRVYDIPITYIGNKKLCSVGADSISEIEFMIYKIV
jgi:hypothetical protein